MIVLMFLVSLFPFVLEGDHFNGGTINWKPVDPYTNSSTVVVTITQTYSWTLSLINCSKNVPITSVNYTANNAYITCTGDCSNDGDYSKNRINILTDCISSSLSLNTLTSERSKNVTLTSGAYFSIGYYSRAWRALDNLDSNGSWSLVSLIDLRQRPDGVLNTPPIPSVVSPVYVIVNRTTPIRISVSDDNVGDHIHCRWAQK
jgi:hypothetical protein